MEGTLRDRLESDLKAALRAGDTTARDTIRFTLAALKNAEIEKGGPLTPAEELALLQREAKRRLESIEQFRAGKRQDLVEREEAQLAVLRRYLPAPLSDEELSRLVAQAIADTGAQSVKDMGKVMPVVMERVAGRAEGRRVSAVVREALSQAS
ncbi:MAG: aspartyl-tRNA amidotransferase subunit B [Thermomicrobiales bacterium]|nr:MAG: aspartyl-tRNA amidotransferase subunit B [Thermomicrobiales bacterium]